MSNKKPFSSWDHFRHKSGSKEWPSSDPEDSPFDTFTCKYCGASAEIQMYGGWFVGEESLWDRARKELRDHLLMCKAYQRSTEDA